MSDEPNEPMPTLEDAITLLQETAEEFAGRGQQRSDEELGAAIEVVLDALAASRQAVEALRGERDAYAIVVAACLRDSRLREIGDWDGGAIQDTLTKAGILAETPVTESCGEDCRCREYDSFPLTCYRVTPIGFKAYEYADRALSRPEEGP